MNPFQDLKKEDAAWMLKLLNQINGNLVEKIMANRKMAFLDKKLSDKVIMDTLFSGKLYTAQKALETGLVDHIGNFSSVVHKDFYGVEIVEPGSKSKWGFETEMMEINSVNDLEAALNKKSFERLFSSHNNGL